MPASGPHAYSEQVAKAFGINDRGELIAGRWCLDSPLGPACMSVYEGDPLFLDWLGPWLEDAQGVTSRLSISRLLPTASGHYYASINGQSIILQSFAAGPLCDIHNSFELFSVSTGVAWVHQFSLGKADVMPVDWTVELRTAKKAADQLKRPRLPKRAQPIWELLAETWRLCLDEAWTKWAAAGLGSMWSLLLGIKGFSDFVYVPDRHLVHYNAVDRCHAGTPAVELAHVLRSSEYSLSTAESILLSYQRVRLLREVEKQQLLACLWFPWEITIEELEAPGLNVVTMNRMRRTLERKVAWVAELGEQLLPDLEDDVPDFDQQVPKPDEELPSPRIATVSIEKEGLDLFEKNEPKTTVQMQEQVKQTNVQETAPNQPDAGAEVEAPNIQMQSKPDPKVLVWKPFPRPLGAPPEDPTPEDKQLGNRNDDADYEEITEPQVDEAQSSEDDDAGGEDQQP